MLQTKPLPDQSTKTLNIHHQKQRTLSKTCIKKN